MEPLSIKILTYDELHQIRHSLNTTDVPFWSVPDPMYVIDAEHHFYVLCVGESTWENEYCLNDKLEIITSQREVWPVFGMMMLFDNKAVSVIDMLAVSVRKGMQRQGIASTMYKALVDYLITERVNFEEEYTLVRTTPCEDVPPQFTFAVDNLLNRYNIRWQQTRYTNGICELVSNQTALPY